MKTQIEKRSLCRKPFRSYYPELKELYGKSTVDNNLLKRRENGYFNIYNFMKEAFGEVFSYEFEE